MYQNQGPAPIQLKWRVFKLLAKLLFYNDFISSANLYFMFLTES